jgi:hypothetical protein
LNGDTDLLAGALSVFRWISPSIAQKLPAAVWREVRLTPPAGSTLPEIIPQHVSWLDRRPWYSGGERKELCA